MFVLFDDSRLHCDSFLKCTNATAICVNHLLPDVDFFEWLKEVLRVLALENFIKVKDKIFLLLNECFKNGYSIERLDQLRLLMLYDDLDDISSLGSAVETDGFESDDEVESVELNAKVVLRLVYENQARLFRSSVADCKQPVVGEKVRICCTLGLALENPQAKVE